MSAGTRLAVWLSGAAALLVLLTAAYDVATSGLLTLRSGYVFGATLIGLGVVLVVGVIRLALAARRGVPHREWWAVGTPLLAAGLVWAVVSILSRVRP